MEQINSKRIKIYHNSNIPPQISLNEINDKLNHINTKLITLDNKINQIGNISYSIERNIERIKSDINKVIKTNETNKITLLKEIGELQNAIIKNLLINKPISNDMLSAYS
tara:strand:+ start:86 stop:415 length:330 start_codon:yes stop_codon:yes gene_type:complete